ncbi:O-antigen ligase family protein [Leptolyngbya cf. ectocarpi LEGE 11479]|uniref:O-antigen ligase family protein n=1 Tax=Leptolyngbya cf. ectocarpi LEGE 11479 TaxID=1828722 RepID=A0A928X117_LEPEC|nr:O-antigen ligase family protein [Leptolyngbya ectocarpi]MBE9067125.1 O-antigen ligase family protein [Leptolyngbya cf. ectocarpi LEGE 11479]
MFQMPTQSKMIPPDCEPQSTGINGVDVLFFLSTLLSPLSVRIFASFTVYDLIVVAMAGIIVLGPRRLKLLPSNFLVAVYVFFLSALVSTFRAPYPIESLTQLLQFILIFMVQLPVILTVIKSAGTKSTAIKVKNMLHVSIFLFLMSELTVLGWARIMQLEAGAGRILTFVSDNPNRLGYPTAYLLPFALYCLIELWHKKHLRIWILPLLPVFYLLLWALAASASRSATVATIISLIVFLTFRQGFTLKPKVILRFVSALVVIGLLGYLLTATNIFPTTLLERAERTASMEASLVDDRKYLAIAGWRAFLDSPFVGVGLDNMRYLTTKYEPNASLQLPHNMWIQFLSTIGIFGTVAFLCIILFWFGLLLKAHHKNTDPSQRNLLAAFVAAMAAVMTIFMFGPIMNNRHYWLIYGLGLALALEDLKPNLK